MTNVDIALLTGHDLRNDNIGVLRLIGADDKVTPHPQLLKLFDHYKYLLSSDESVKDNILYKAGMAWAYSTFLNLYGEKIVYREPVNIHLTTNQVFYKKYLMEVDPLLVSLSLNSMAYLWFCTEEYDLVKRITKRLIQLSLVWKTFAYGLPTQILKVCTPSGDKTLESHWIKYIPSFELLNNRNIDIDFKIHKLLPSGFVTCIQDIYTAFNLFRRNDYNGHNVPSNINWAVFAKICFNADTSIGCLIETLKKLDSIFFDPEFMFNGLRWECTHQELLSLLKSGQLGYNNPNLWLLLCYLNHTGKLIINGGYAVDKHKWSVYNMELGQAMFDHFVYKNTESIMAYLDIIQYKRNRKFENAQKNALIQLMKRYREFGLALDPKKLGIKRGVLINLLSAGYGDIFCIL